MSGEESSFASRSRTRLDRTVAPLAPTSRWWLVVPPLPIVVTLAVITAGYVASGGRDPGFPPQFATLVYGIANVVVLGGLFVRWSRDRWRAVALFRRPSWVELGAGVLATVVGVAIGWPATTVLADALGVPRYSVPTLSSSLGIVGYAFGAVVVAPVVEEVLYRGLFVGVALDRWDSRLLAGAGSLLLFGLIHVFTAGLAGVVNAVLLGGLLTWLRFRFDNLVGAWLFHVLNNLLELLVGLSLVPSLYAL